MRMIEIDYEAQPPVDSYGPGGFRVDGNWHQGGIIMLADGPHAMTGPMGVDALAPVFSAASQLDLIIIGQGVEIAHIPGDLRRALEQAGLGIEVMATPSACRTYNVLLNEDRRVAAALIPVT